MPLFQPSNITPSSFAGVDGRTIDANDNVSISWQVNGNEPMTAFKIDIYQTQNNAQVQVGTSGFQTVPTNTYPDGFYPTDNKGNPNYYPYEPNVAWSDLAVSGQSITNGNEYTLQITQWWGTNPTASSTTFIQQISQSAFITREKPTLIITGLPSVGTAVQSVSLPISAIFTQANGDSVEWVRWQFYQTDENGENAVLLDDTGVVNTQVFSYTLDNMFNGNDYKIVCTAQSENGIQVVAEQNFTVAYELPNIIGQFSVDCSDKMSNLLSWKDIAVETGDSIIGTASGNYSFNNGNLVLPNNSSVLWESVNDVPESLNIASPWTLAWKGTANYYSYPTQTDTISTNSFYQLTNINQVATLTPSKTFKKVVYCNYNQSYYGIDDTSIYLINFSGTTTSYTTLYTYSQQYETRILLDIDVAPSTNKLVVAGSALETTNIKISMFEITSNGLSRYSIGSQIQFYGTTYAVKFLDDNYLATLNNYYLSGNQDTTAKSVAIVSLELVDYDIYTWEIKQETDLEALTGGNISRNFGSKNGYGNGYFSVNYQNGSSYYCMMYSYTNSQDTSDATLLSKFSTGGLGLFSPVENIFVSGSNIYKIVNNSVERIGSLPVSGLNPVAFNTDGRILILQPRYGIMQTYQANIYNETIMGIKVINESIWEAGIFEMKNGVGLTRAGEKFTYYIESLFDYSKQSLSNLYQASVVSVIGANSTNISNYNFDYTDASYSLSGATAYPQSITANISLVFKNVIEDTTYINISDWLKVQRNINVLEFVVNSEVINSVDIPSNAGIMLFVINANSITVYFNGEATGTTQSVSITQQPITSIQLVGEQTTSWVVVENGTKTIPSNYSPIWSTENGTQFLTNFGLNTFEAGQLSVAEPKLEIYRENLQTGKVQKIFKTDLDISQLRDYSWITGEQYKYTAYALLDNVYTGEQTFNPYPICKRQNFYLLLETVQDETQLNVYHVVNSWRFGANIEAGSVSNNNNPNFLTNFTPYRTKQPTTRNSESGTLTALLSNVQNGKYADTVEQMKALKAISNSLNTFFLKDMKGDLLLVSIAGAITKKVNTKSSVQETTVSIPWEETGSADGVSIIQTPNDNGWVGSNDIAKVRLATKIDGDNIAQELGLPDGVSIDFIDGQLYVNYPDGYTGTTFSLDENGNLIATTPEQQQQPQLYLDNGTVKLAESVLPVANTRNNYKFSELQKLDDAVGAKVEVKFILPNGEEV